MTELASVFSNGRKNTEQKAIELLQKHYRDTFRYLDYQVPAYRTEYLKRAIDLAEGMDIMLRHLCVNYRTFQKLYIEFLFEIKKKMGE